MSHVLFHDDGGVAPTTRRKMTSLREYATMASRDWREARDADSADHFRQEPDEDVRVGLSGAEERQPRDPRGARSSRSSGPNGAGKTTLIGVICGTVNPTSGTVIADGHDIVKDYRAARSDDRPRSSRALDRHVRDRVGHGDLQPRPLRQSRRTRPTSRRCCASCRSGTSETARS